MFQPRDRLLPECQRMKEELNAARDRLNETEPISWSKHTSFTNRAGSLVGGLKREFQPEMSTMVCHVIVM